MPSPFPFLNMGKAAARGALEMAANDRVGVETLQNLQRGRRSVNFQGAELPTQLGRRIGETPSEFERVFIDEQIVPTLPKAWGPPPYMEMVIGNSGPYDGMNLLAVFDNETRWGLPSIWRNRLQAIGLNFVGQNAKINPFGTPAELFTIPEDPMLSGRRFLNE